MNEDLQEYRSAKFQATTQIWSKKFEQNVCFLESFLFASEYLDGNFEEAKKYLIFVVKNCCDEIGKGIDLDENVDRKGEVLLKHTIREIIKAGMVEKSITHEEILMLIYKNINFVKKPKFSFKDKLILFFQKLRYHILLFLFGKPEK
jgi:hypothetical protein